LGEGGLVLGVLESTVFKEISIPFNPGDLLLLYSDGITEAMNESFEEFGEERMMNLVNKNRHDSSQNIVEDVFKAVQQHTGDAPQTDDMTMVIVRREN